MTYHFAFKVIKTLTILFIESLALTFERFKYKAFPTPIPLVSRFLILILFTRKSAAADFKTFKIESYICFLLNCSSTRTSWTLLSLFPLILQINETQFYFYVKRYFKKINTLRIKKQKKLITINKNQNHVL